MSYSGLTFANLRPFDPRPVPIIRAIGEDSLVPRRAIEALRRGQAIVFPTDTVYGLGCRIDDEVSVRRVYEIKGRPSTEPLPVLLADPNQVQTYARTINAA
ncbi:MAG TPA: Sua5/YciO/YrdC/YwlC family protein, partial [bacterium]|nr:Sua5/YciO/YrdC/YwlC family protein [bacterium]